MIGALIGDCIGSFWEFSGNKDPAIPLWVPASRFTDDSVCTAAVASWLTAEDRASETLVDRLRHLAMPHLGVGFGNMMVKWLLDAAPHPYGSWGNGSAMRVSPVALVAHNEQELLDLAARSAEITHNHPDAVRGAQAAAWAIRFALERGAPGLLEAVESRFGYDGLTQRDPESERATHLFDVSCKGTVPLALAIAVRAGSFDNAMRWCCSIGGDADTLAAIAGPVCEALYGIPEQHLHNAAIRFQGTALWDAVANVYALPDVRRRLGEWGYRQTPLPATGPQVDRLRLHFT